MRKLFVSLSMILFSWVMLSAQDYLPKWQEGYMDIHTVATGRGDATFIVMPDGTTLLIDAGDNGKTKDKQHPDTTKRAGEWLSIYIEKILEDLPMSDGKIDYAMITHLHDDHMGSVRQMLPGKNGYGLSGITLVGERVGFHTLMDRAYPEYDFPNKTLNGTNKKFMPEYHKFVKYQVSQGMKMQQFKAGALNQIYMKNNPRKYKKSFEIRNLCSNAEVWTGKGESVKKAYSGDPNLFDENVNSCGVRITYGDFKYYNTGDLSGGNWHSYKSKERDIESHVAKVCGEVNVMKANHHGYYDTCNGFFLNMLSPEVIIIDARSDNHPVPSTMARMSDPMVLPQQPEFYITVDQPRKKLGEELWSKFKPWGHIVVRVYEGGKTYQLFVLDADKLDYPVIYKSDLKNAAN